MVLENTFGVLEKSWNLLLSKTAGTLSQTFTYLHCFSREFFLSLIPAICIVIPFLSLSPYDIVQENTFGNLGSWKVLEFILRKTVGTHANCAISSLCTIL